MANYRELIVWQKAMDLAVVVYQATEQFPKSELFGLSQQLRRAAVSIPSNVAEGQGRFATKDYVHFLRIAIGSLQELETQVILANRLNYFGDDVRDSLLKSSSEVSRLLAGLFRKLKPNDS